MAGQGTPRQLARVQTLQRIRSLAWQQVSESGPTQLSLRQIARDLDLVSSAIYRYYASRDELITALIVEAYGELAAALEEASIRDRRGPRRRWEETAFAFRRWATTEPHRFGLIYGTVIPGYRAPADTITPAARVMRAFLCGAGCTETARASLPMPRGLARQVDQMAAALAVAADTRLVAAIGTFSEIVGLLTLELGGHFVGGFDPAEALYAIRVDAMAERLQL